jgi:fibronectin-binding autotransporter adhesin
VQGGTLDVSLKSGFTLSGTETLKGNGSVVGAVVAAAGSLIEPGESIGTLSLIGDVAISGTLLTEYDESNTQKTDVLAVTGDVNLENASFDFAGIGDPLSGGPYVFLTYTGMRTGEAAVVEADLPAGYQVAYDVGGQNAALVAIPEPSTFLLLAVGLIGAAVFARRRRSRH